MKMGAKKDTGPKIRKSKLKLKKFNVKVIKNPKKTSIWIKENIAKNSDSLYDTFDIDEICNKFENVTIVAKKEVVKEVKVEVKQKLLFDGGKSGTIIRQRQSIRGMTNEDLLKGILSMDETKINIDTLLTLSTILPTNDEMKQLIAMQNDEGEFGQAEQICLLFKDIPSIQDRIQSWIYKLQFNEGKNYF
jgi:hypothetical protein